MKKKLFDTGINWKKIYSSKLWKIMRLSGFLFIVCVFQVLAGRSYSQSTKLSLNLNQAKISQVLNEIENRSEFYFLYNHKLIDVDRKVDIDVKDKRIKDILTNLFAGTDVNCLVMDRQIVLSPKDVTETVNVTRDRQPQEIVVTGKVTDEDGNPLPGVNIVIKGTITGTITNADGNYSIEVDEPNVTLVFSFIGYRTQEVTISGRNVINITLIEEAIGLDEVVAIGYGTMRKSDLTGSVVRADIETFREQPNISLMQSLHGSVAGLNVGQVNQSGGESDISIRGRTSISGETAPLIVVDNIIFRGNLIDLNPNDIESVDILKDASSAAIYGSQASNGVILITTTKSGGVDGKPVVNYSSYYAFQRPVKELKPGGPDQFMKKTEESDIYNSRTEESGYLEINPDWEPTGNFKTSDEINAYQQGRSTNWYDILTNDNMYTQNHNLSLANRTKYNNYYVSIGYTDQLGHMLNEDYNRLNARINIDNTITDWLKIGIQSFMTTSDYSGQDASPYHRYLSPFATAYDEDGEYIPIVLGQYINPLIQAKADHLDKRLNLFGNIYADINIPFIEGLTYKINFSNNYRTTSEYYFRSYAQSFQGEGSKTEGIGNDWSVDNIMTYKRVFNDIHNVDVTLLYGVEKRKYNFTNALSSVFSTYELGYNRLQTGSAELQEAISGAWDEASLYNMARLFYSFRTKYMFTGTIRRDGFSGFSKENKFGLFPSASVAWVASKESFIQNNLGWMNLLKFRASYGSNGNRTIGRYETLATVSGGYNYITADGSPVFTQSISSLASPNLKWETTTGINLGVDFGFLSSRIYGTIDYYNNNTTDLLYNVDIPGIGRFTKFPDNLGKIHNKGIELTLSSVNLKMERLRWTSSFIFSRNRNELKELLGFDLDDDGKEDDLVAEGLFIGESLDAIYTYEIDGKWQVNDDILSGYDLGANKVVDINGDGTIDADDRTIIGYREPSYRFSINNVINYNNWTIRVFINSVQGGKNHYMASDDLLALNIMNKEDHFNDIFPEGLDYWTPENPDAIYQRPNINVSGVAGIRYIQRNFVRLQDVSISYNFASNTLNRFHIQNLKLYVSGKNLVTLTKWPGWDPETGIKITRGGLPVIKSFTIGINVEF